jgi:hypothetical protein
MRGHEATKLFTSQGYFGVITPTADEVKMVLALADQHGLTLPDLRSKFDVVRSYGQVQVADTLPSLRKALEDPAGMRALEAAKLFTLQNHMGDFEPTADEIKVLLALADEHELSLSDLKAKFDEVRSDDHFQVADTFPALRLALAA